MVTSETIIEDPNTNHFDLDKITEYPDANYIDSDEVSGKISIRRSSSAMPSRPCTPIQSETGTIVEVREKENVCSTIQSIRD